MSLSEHKGIFFAFLTAIFSGFAIFFNGFAVRSVGDPLVFTTLKNLFVGFISISIVILFKRFPQLKKTTSKEKLYLVLIGIIGGSVPFYLFFTALKNMPPVNAAIIHKTLILWVAILAVIFLNERLSRKQLGALVFLFGSNFFIGGFRGFTFSMPEFLVLLATLFWAIENIIAKKVLKTIHPDIVVAARMGIGSLILLSTVILSGKSQILISSSYQHWLLILVTVALLTGYVMSWYRALSLAPATTVATVLVFGAVITNILTAVFKTHTFTFNQFSQIVFITSGVWFFLREIKMASSTPFIQSS